MADTPLIPTDLNGSVGRNGDNQSTDILAVQGLLALAATKNAGGTTFLLPELGQPSTKLGDAIEKFQRFHTLPLPDGRVDRGKSTWKKLIEVATRPGPLPPGPTPVPGRLLAEMPGTPPWEDWGHRPLPPLSTDLVVETAWELQFGGTLADWPMTSKAYQCDKALGTPHVGIGLPEGITRPSAYLLYFHHSLGNEAASYASADVRFRKGIGDYLIGRMKGMEQVSRSGKNVCLVVPEPTFAGQGVFDRNEGLITRALQEIDADLCGEERELPPLVVASYSDGLERLDNFMKNCPTLRQRVRALYDFDGMLVTRLSGISLSNWAKAGVQTFRYVGNSSPGLLPNEPTFAYIGRCMGRSPRLVPLPKARWVNHPKFSDFKTNPGWANPWWLHFYIPSCMLVHGLARTDGI